MAEIKVEKVTLDKLDVLQKLSIDTFRETFGFDNTEEELQQFFDENYTLAQLKKDVTDKESDVRFVKVDGREVGFMKVNWGAAQTEHELENAFEIQRIWEGNVKAQGFYRKYGFEKFSEHSFKVGDKVDTDWLMRKALKE